MIEKSLTRDEFNAVRDRAADVCKDMEAAEKAWSEVAMNSRCHGRAGRYARFVMLTALADGKSVRAAKMAAMRALK